jgi:putative restriction endonuclease
MSVSEETLVAAYSNGFAVERTTRGEVTLAFLPDLLVHYFQHAGCLHGFARSVRDTKVLRAVGSDRYSPDGQALASVARGRRGALRSLQHVLRSRSFRARVLTAYGMKCAVCGLASRPPDALHLVPPVPGGGTNDTSNGIALCTTHHKAYDAALITIADDYRVFLSEARVETLSAANLHGGLDAFRQSLRPYIFIPPEPGLRPLPENLRRGREIRGWIE